MSGITITLDGLEAFIERKVEEQVAAALAARGPDPWLNSKEAAAYLGIAVATLYDLVADGKLPRVGGRKTKLMFRRSTLDAYLDSRGGANPSNEGGE